MIKARKITVKDDVAIAHRFISRVKLEKTDISSVSLKNVPSLVDEIGLTICGKYDVFITDATLGFNELALWFDFHIIFGGDWYKRAESGEHLYYEFE